MQHGAMRIRENLHLDVPRLRQICLQIDAAVPKGQLGLTPDEWKLPLQCASILHNTDSLATAALCRLNHQWITDRFRGSYRFL